MKKNLIENYKEYQELVTHLLAQRKHENFIRFCWQNPSSPFLVGIHTREVCRIIDNAFSDFRNGKSVFLIITIPFRHGKSDCISRYLPAHFLGEFPDCDVMLATYSMSLAQEFSRFGRRLIRSDEYKKLYPEICISKESASTQRWLIKGHLGGVSAGSLSAGLTGKGYHLGLLDDYCGSRADAESETIRNSMWEHFTNDFFTRRAPQSMTIILATPWHTDDIIGRIRKRIDINSDEYDPKFPKFQLISFPAKNGSVDIYEKNRNVYGDLNFHKKHIDYEYLFLERFSKEWYEEQFASLGTYSSSALLQCNPQIRGGNLFVTDKIQYHDSVSDFPNTKYIRVWDYAHTAKQTQKDDPDWTSGTLLAYTKVEGVWHLWIKNVARIRAKAPERDAYVRSVTEKDGSGVAVYVENSVDSKDAVSNLQTVLSGRRIVKPINIGIDKVARASYVESIFEAGHVHVLRGDWNLDWIDEVKSFPSGKHDDQVDNITAGYMVSCNGTSQVKTGRVIGV